jgi:hypothetical protein
VERIMTLRRLFALVASFGAALAAAQTTIEHSSLSYFVPGKRITVDAKVVDAKGVKVARTYFRAGAQADYTYVPMQYTSGNRYTATLPAPAAGTPSIEYLVLAQSNDGTVSRTPAYTMPVRNSGEAPSWQATASRGDVKVFTEAANAPATVSGFSDSITLDVAESGARLGAVAGLYSGASGGGAAGATASGATSGTTSAAATTTTTTTATSTAATTAGTTAGATATAGGLSTAAIVGGVAVAGVAAAAAASGGGGGSSSPPASQGSPFAGTWTGTTSSPETFTCINGGVTTVTSCTSTQPFTAIVDSTGRLTLNFGTGTDICNGSSQTLPPFSISNIMVSPTGTATFTPQVDAGGTVDVCTPITLTFSLSPRTLTGSGTCTVQSNTPGVTCSGSGTTTFTGTGS